MLEEEAGVVLMREEPGSLVGVSEVRAALDGPSWSLATTGESDVNLRTRSLTELAWWNWDDPLRGVGSGRDQQAVSGWGVGLPEPRHGECGQYLDLELAAGD